MKQFSKTKSSQTVSHNTDCERENSEPGGSNTGSRSLRHNNCKYVLYTQHNMPDACKAMLNMKLVAIRMILIFVTLTCFSIIHSYDDVSECSC